eukprot:4540980-Pyramimonas_sp.AAC.1
MPLNHRRIRVSPRLYAATTCRCRALGASGSQSKSWVDRVNSQRSIDAHVGFVTMSRVEPSETGWVWAPFTAGEGALNSRPPFVGSRAAIKGTGYQRHRNRQGKRLPS